MKIKNGDTVLIISGKDRGKKGKVIKVLIEENRIVVEGANLRKKHTRPKKQGEKGQIVEIAAPLDVSNVKLICPRCKKATRIGYRVAEKNKFRICKKCNQEI
jgi:large subunit ribosomal protein L24